MKRYIVITFLIILSSCKNNSEESSNSIMGEPVESNELTVKIGLKTNKKDKFKIMLNKIRIDEFQTKNIVIEESVPISSGFESIIAKFGPDNTSNNLVINLGNSKNKVIKLNALEFSYGDNVVLITKENFNRFLRANKFVTYNKDDFSLTTKKIENKHSPSLVAKKVLLDSLFK